jgi:hypothetical protein
MPDEQHIDTAALTLPAATLEALGVSQSWELRPLDLRTFIVNAGPLVSFLWVDLFHIATSQGFEKEPAIEAACEGVRGFLVECLSGDSGTRAWGWYAPDGRLMDFQLAQNGMAIPDAAVRAMRPKDAPVSDGHFGNYI